MNQCAYFDVFDPRRTWLGGTPDEVREACQSIRIGQAELMMSVFRGWTPVVPQTYGWDCPALLNYAAQQGREGASFRWLMAKGFIRVGFRGAPSLWDAALAAFDSRDYVRLYAWPEFNTTDPWEARRPLVEAMRTNKAPHALPDSARHRLEVLAELSAAVKQAPEPLAESTRDDKLSRLLAHTIGVASHVDKDVADLLWQCTQIHDSGRRMSVDTFLEGQKRAGVLVAPAVHEIVDYCFNVVSAEVVGAKRTGLSTPRSQPRATETLLAAFPTSMRRTDVFEGSSMKLPTDRLTELEVVGWDTVVRFLKDAGDLPLEEGERVAEASKLIGTTAVDGMRRYVLQVNGVAYVAGAAIGGIATLLGSIATDPLVGSVIGTIAGAVGVADVRSRMRDHISSSLKKTWTGLLRSE